MLNFFKNILQLFIFLLILMLYFSGFVLIPSYFELIIKDELYIKLFFIGYLLLGAIICYYASGIKRRKTKNILIILGQDLIDFKKCFIEFIKGIGTLAKGLLILTGFLLAIGAIILVFIFFGWLVFSLSATTIIIILLVLILLKLR